MPPDKSLIGKETEATTCTIDASSVIEFAKGVGETDPIHLDPEAARAAGYPDVVAPPTYPIAFMAESMNPELFFELGLNIMSIVHGEQEFLYHRPVCGGETLTMKGRIGDIWEKEGRSGVLDFVVMEAHACEPESGDPVYTSKITMISKRQS